MVTLHGNNSHQDSLSNLWILCCAYSGVLVSFAKIMRFWFWRQVNVWSIIERRMHMHHACN